MIYNSDVSSSNWTSHHLHVQLNKSHTCIHALMITCSSKCINTVIYESTQTHTQYVRMFIYVYINYYYTIITYTYALYLIGLIGISSCFNKCLHYVKMSFITCYVQWRTPTILQYKCHHNQRLGHWRWMLKYYIWQMQTFLWCRSHSIHTTSGLRHCTYKNPVQTHIPHFCFPNCVPPSHLHNLRWPCIRKLLNITSLTLDLAMFTSAPAPNKLCTTLWWPSWLAICSGVVFIW